MKVLFGESLPKETVKEEKKNGIRFAEVTLGKSVLIHTYFFRMVYISYADIRRIYMRVAGGEFGEFPIDEYSLVIEDISGKEHILHMDRGEFVEGIKEWLKIHQPHIVIGKKQE